MRHGRAAGCGIQRIGVLGTTILTWSIKLYFVYIFQKMFFVSTEKHFLMIICFEGIWCGLSAKTLPCEVIKTKKSIFEKFKKH